MKKNASEMYFEMEGKTSKLMLKNKEKIGSSNFN